MYNSNVAELKVVENFDLMGGIVKMMKHLNQRILCLFLIDILRMQILTLDKSLVQKMLQEVYQEACELI